MSNTSGTSTPTESPVHVQPLHNPSLAAHVAVPQAPLGNATNGTANQTSGLGAKALLAKKMAKNHNPNFVSPTDNMMTPCTKKISAAKKRHFATRPARAARPLFASQKEASESEKSEGSADESSSAMKIDDDDGNPF